MIYNNTVEKQPAESFIIGVNFSNILQSDEYIELNDSEYVAYDLDNPTPDTLIIFPASLAVDVQRKTLMGRIEGGYEGYSYKVSFRAHTDKGNIFEQDIFIRMRD